jgi:hypothetical protein
MYTVTRFCLSFVLIVAGTMAPHSGFCEEAVSNSDIELLRSDIRKQKVALITDRMQFTNREADAFWPIYRKYEVELAAINDRKIALLKDYVSRYDTMNDEQAKQLAQGVLEADQATAELRRRVFSDLAASLSPKTAARWLQLERRLQLFLDAKLAKDVPTLKR